MGEEKRIPDITRAVLEEILSDDENDSEALIDYYDNCTEEQKEAVDKTLICLCGYRLSTLFIKAEERGLYVGEE